MLVERKRAGSISATYSHIWAFVLSAAVIIGLSQRLRRPKRLGTDRGDAIVAAMIEALRTRGILLPAATILERIGLAARARARKQAHKNLIEGLEQRTVNELRGVDRGQRRQRSHAACVVA